MTDDYLARLQAVLRDGPRLQDDTDVPQATAALRGTAERVRALGMPPPEHAAAVRRMVSTIDEAMTEAEARGRFEDSPTARRMGEAMAEVINILERAGLGSRMVVVGRDDPDAEAKIREALAGASEADIERALRGFRDQDQR